MKYWEVIKAIDEGTKDVFVHESGDNPDILILRKYTDGWNRVKQPVTWQEAIEAWAVQRKNITCKYGNSIYKYKANDSGEFVTLEDQDGSPPSIEELTKGTWYIEEESK